MKAVVALLCSALALSAAPQSELAHRIPLKLAHLAQMKRQDPQQVFNVREPKTRDVVAQLSRVVLDAEGERPKFVVLYLYDNVAQQRPQIVAPWEALTVNTNHSELFINVGTERLRQIPVITADQVPNRAPPNWGTEYYTLYGVQPRQSEPEPDAVGIAAQISGVVEGSGSGGGSRAAVNVTRGNKTFIWLGLGLVIFGVAMLMRRLARPRREHH